MQKNTITRLVIICFALVIITSCTKKEDSPTKKQVSFYSLGHNFGETLTSIKQKGQQLNQEELIRGLRDAFENSSPGIAPEKSQQFITALSELLSNQQASETMQPARGKKFIDDYAKLNAERPGVVVTASGVQYEVIHRGTGRAQPQSSDTVMVNYKGTLTNGVVFDGSSDDGKPVPLKINEVAVPGLKEALMLMHPGDKWRVVIPPKMGFINFGNNRLRRRDLIYEIELVSIEASK